MQKKLNAAFKRIDAERAAEVAKVRQQIAVDFYNCLYQEANITYQSGRIELDKIIQ